MNEPIRRSDVREPDAASTRLITDTSKLLTELERLLAGEVQLLSSGQVDGLEAVARAKGLVVQQIDGYQTRLVSLMEQFPEHPDVQKLKHRLMQCREENRNNHALVMLELKHTNKSLELLRSVLQMNDLSLYGEHGEVQIKREKRRLGSA